MKLSLAVVASLAVSANAFYVGRPVDFDHLRIGHTGIARDAIPDAEPEAEVARAVSEVVAREPHQRYQNDAPIFVEVGRIPPRPENQEHHKEHRPCHGKHMGFSFSGLLARLGFIEPKERAGYMITAGEHHGHHGDHHHHHGGKHHGGKHHDHDKAPEKPVVTPPEAPESEYMNILPIFGEDATHKQIEQDLAAQAEEESKAPEEHQGKKKGKHHHHHHHHHHDHDDDHKYKHKHHKGHKHKHHKHKGHKDNKVFASLADKQHKLCDALKSLPPALRGFVIGAVVGAILQVIFSLFFLAIRLRGRHCAAAREARRERRRERKEARKAAKAAYKASKAARNGKAQEAGFEIEDDEEALPSYAEGEQDPLVVRQ